MSRAEAAGHNCGGPYSGVLLLSRVCARVHYCLKLPWFQSSGVDMLTRLPTCHLSLHICVEKTCRRSHSAAAPTPPPTSTEATTTPTAAAATKAATTISTPTPMPTPNPSPSVSASRMPTPSPTPTPTPTTAARVWLSTLVMSS